MIKLAVHALLLAIPLLITGLAVGAQMDEPQLRRSGFLGVQVGPVTDDRASSGDLQVKSGVLVVGLVEGGSAGAAGFRRGDIIIAMNGNPVDGPAEFARAVGRLRAGDEVSIRYVRDGAPGVTRVVIRARRLESAPDVATDYRAVAVDGGTRRAIVTRPKSPGRYPAVLYITGIGCFSQESIGVQSTESKLLYGLTRRGFVTMRVEKTGVGDSQGPSCESERADLQSEVKGYVEGLRALRNYDFVDPENVFPVGLSIGGVEAPLVAQQASVKGIVVINTVARSFLDYLQDIRRTQRALRKTPYDVLESNLRINARCNYELFVEHKPVETLLDNEPACGEWVRYPAPRAFMQQWAELNPAAQWKDVSVPVLILHGEYDFIASAIDGAYLPDTVESFHAGMATHLSVPKMDHYMAHVTSWSESLNKISGMLGEFESSLIDIVGVWLQGHSG